MVALSEGDIAEPDPLLVRLVVMVVEETTLRIKVVLEEQ